MRTEDVSQRTAALMPELMELLERLVAIPSVAFPGYPSEPVTRMGNECVRALREAGCTDAQLMAVRSGHPPVYGVLDCPPGSPVVLLYAHYDVQPAPPEQGWTSDPWTLACKEDGRCYGRGAADDKSGLVAHVGTLKVLADDPPCTLAQVHLIQGLAARSTNGGPYRVTHRSPRVGTDHEQAEVVVP